MTEPTPDGLVAPVDGRAPVAGGAMLTAAIAVEGTLLAVAVVGGWLAGRSVVGQVALTGEALVWSGTATVPLVVAMWWSMRAAWLPAARLRALVHRMVVPLFAQCPIWSLGVIAACAGVGEEALFRGLLQPLLAGPLGVTGAVLVTSVIFGVLHMISPAYAILAGIMSVYLGALAVWTDNLLVPILVHALYDFAALLMLQMSREM